MLLWRVPYLHTHISVNTCDHLGQKPHPLEQIASFLYLPALNLALEEHIYVGNLDNQTKWLRSELA